MQMVKSGMWYADARIFLDRRLAEADTYRGLCKKACREAKRPVCCCVAGIIAFRNRELIIFKNVARRPGSFRGWLIACARASNRVA